MSTRQATPVPSSSTRKRSITDIQNDSESRSVKKSKYESPSTKELKRRKRKKKTRKTSVVVNAGLIQKPIVVTAVASSSKSSDIHEGTSYQSPLEPASDSTLSNEDSNSEVIEKLNAEIASQSTLIAKHQDAISQIQQHITCQICFDLLYKPYALAPCGHIACYSCLYSWFTRPSEEGPAAHQPPIWYRKKICPHCRATIREPPVEVWAVKNMVNGLVGSGLLVGMTPPPEADGQASGPDSTGTQPQTEISRDELWKNVFYPSHPHADSTREEVGIYDEEDGVYRCIDCTHEIEGFVCSHCQREYPGHAGSDFSDGEEGFYHPDFIDDDDEPIWLPPFDFMPGPWEELWGDDGSDYEGSLDGFIDDGEVHDHQDGGEGNVNEEAVDLDDDDYSSDRGQGPTEVIEVSDDEEADDYLPLRRHPSRRVIHLVSDEEEEEEEGDDESGIPVIDPLSGRPIVIDSTDDEDESDLDFGDDRTLHPRVNPDLFYDEDRSENGDDEGEYPYYMDDYHSEGEGEEEDEYGYY